METFRKPDFDFDVPVGYSWLIDRNLVGFTPESGLQPWYFVPEGQVIDLSRKWPSGPSGTRLVVFARRQDCDDLACFEVTDQRATRIVLVHGWTEAGYSILQKSDDFWEWLKSVVDDIAEWVDLAPL